MTALPRPRWDHVRVRLFLLGAPCAGKTTLAVPLRGALGCPVLDMDDELVRVNGGTWPALQTKRALSSRVIDEASGLDRVVLLHSRVDDEQLAMLRDSAWVVGLLDAPEALLRARAAERQARDGWSNVQWLTTHLRDIEALRGRRAFSHIIDATQPTWTLVRVVAGLMGPDADRPRLVEEDESRSGNA